MVQFVANHGIVGREQCFKQAAVRVETGRIKDGVFGAKKVGESLFKLLMKSLRAADKADGSEAVAPLIERFVSGSDYFRMVGQAEIVVRAEIQNFAPGDYDMRVLWRFNLALALFQPRFANVAKFFDDMLWNVAGHRVSS